MKRSLIPTPYILIRATNSCRRDTVDFALIHLTDSWKDLLAQRLSTLTRFAKDESFHNITYWESPLGFYRHPTNRFYTENLLSPEEEWIYVTLNGSQEQRFLIPVEGLEDHQLVITGHGYANFVAYNARTSEQCWTVWFSISELICKSTNQLC